LNRHLVGRVVGNLHDRLTSLRSHVAVVGGAPTPIGPLKRHQLGLVARFAERWSQRPGLTDGRRVEPSGPLKGHRAGRGADVAVAVQDGVRRGACGRRSLGELPGRLPLKGHRAVRKARILLRSDPHGPRVRQDAGHPGSGPPLNRHRAGEAPRHRPPSTMIARHTRVLDVVRDTSRPSRPGLKRHRPGLSPILPDPESCHRCRSRAACRPLKRHRAARAPSVISTTAGLGNLAWRVRAIGLSTNQRCSPLKRHRAAQRAAA
jgi:hypothetical protein